MRGSFLSDITLMNVCRFIFFVSCCEGFSATWPFLDAHSIFEYGPSSWVMIEPIAPLFFAELSPPLRFLFGRADLSSDAGIVCEKTFDSCLLFANLVFLSKSASFYIGAPEFVMNFEVCFDEGVLS